MSSDIDAAIAQTSTTRIVVMQGELRPGRPFAFNVPDDLTVAEALTLIRLMTEMPERLAAKRGPRLLVPR